MIRDIPYPLLCRDCRHYFRMPKDRALCIRKAVLTREPVHGWIHLPEDSPLCADERQKETSCGPLGVFFESPPPRETLWSALKAWVKELKERPEE